MDRQRSRRGDPRARGVVARGTRALRRPASSGSTRRSTPSSTGISTAPGQRRTWPTKPSPTATRSAPLHGVPMTIKDSFQTEGCITTSGAPDLAQHLPDADAWPVARLRAAGAIPFAKTNLPIFAGDIQSFNDVYGTTNNPHDLDRTCGGSSGGSAAALSMGFTPIELGSDIGGSIRVPAHYCGVMGHKPSFGDRASHGQIPGMPGTFAAGRSRRDRSDGAVDRRPRARARRARRPRPVERTRRGRLELPPARRRHLDGLRIAAWLDDDLLPGRHLHRRVLARDGRRRSSRPVVASTPRRDPASRSRRSTPCSSICCSRRSRRRALPREGRAHGGQHRRLAARVRQAGHGDAPPRLAVGQRTSPCRSASSGGRSSSGTT